MNCILFNNSFISVALDVYFFFNNFLSSYFVVCKYIFYIGLVATVYVQAVRINIK